MERLVTKPPIPTRMARIRLQTTKDGWGYHQILRGLVVVVLAHRSRHERWHS